MVAIGENEIRGSMHSGWNQSSRMFLRGYTTHINRLPTLRSSISITKVAIVLLTASFSFIFHPSKIYFGSDSIDAYFKSFPLSFMRIVDTNRSDRFDHADTTTDRYEITIRYYTSFIISLLFYFSFFSSLFPFLLLSLFSLFFQIPCRYRGGIRVIYMEKVDGGSWIRAKFVRFCSDFMNVSRRVPSPVPDDAVSGEN